MRMSCNGCRVLRKGCSDNCSIRPCLQWIKNPEAQGNATLFLAKFYGRAGLLNLINAGPDHLRPAIFRSLLYEACGRIVNPTYGSVGLLWSGKWQLCQAAVEAVLKGAPIMQISFETNVPASDSPLPPLHKASSYDIRHIGKVAKGHELHEVIKENHVPFKRRCVTGSNPPMGFPIPSAHDDHAHGTLQWPKYSFAVQREPSYDSSATQASDPAAARTPLAAKVHDGRENGSPFSVETVELMLSSQGVETRKTSNHQISEERDVALELTLGFDSPHGSGHTRNGLTLTAATNLQNAAFSWP